jgi:threonine/homoserine/homoserine lactone efflux protein
MGGAAAAGFGLGFAVAVQVGPIWLLCARTVLRGAFLSGVAIGTGAAVIDTSYAALGVAGVNRALEHGTVRLALGLVGAMVLAFLGARTLWSAFRVRLGGELQAEVATPGRAFLTSLAATASNPLTIASWAAVFSAASAASVVGGWSQTTAFLAGIGCGTFTWFLVLSSALAVGRRRLGLRLIVVADVFSGVALIGFAGLLAWRAAAD